MGRRESKQKPKPTQTAPGLRRHLDEIPEDPLIGREDMLRAVLESTAEGILAVSSTGKVILANRHFAQLWRIPPDLYEEGSDEELLEFVQSQLSEPDAFMERIRELYGSAQDAFDILHFLDGRVFERFSHPLLSGSRIVGRVWGFRDVTERRRAEAALREERQYREEILANSEQGIAVCDRELRIKFWSPFLEESTGLSAGEVIGNRLMDVFPFLVEQRLDSIFERALRGEKTSFGDLAYTIPKTGLSGTVVGTVVPHHDGAGEIAGIIILARDITERLRSERVIADQRLKMTNAARMAALGTMAAGIGHEINTPLGIIAAGVLQLQSIHEQSGLRSEQAREITDLINRNTDRAFRIIQSLMSLAREGSADPFKTTPAAEVVRSTLELCQGRFMSHGIDLALSNIAEGLALDCRPSQVSQVLLNLLNNAFDAVANLPEKWVRLDVAECDDHVEFAIANSGPRLAGTLAEKIFIPFFTTKREGMGIGLGLSISKGIVDAHNGRIFVDPDCPNTRFVVTLPKTQII